MPGKIKPNGNRKRRTRANYDVDENSEPQVICEKSQNQTDKKYVPTFTAPAKRAKQNQKEEKYENGGDNCRQVSTMLEGELELPKKKTDASEIPENKVESSPSLNTIDTIDETEKIRADGTTSNDSHAAKSTKENGKKEISETDTELSTEQIHDAMDENPAETSSQGLDLSQIDIHNTATGTAEELENDNAAETIQEEKVIEPQAVHNLIGTTDNENQIVPDTTISSDKGRSAQCEELIDSSQVNMISLLEETEEKQNVVKDVDSNASGLNCIREQERAQGATEMKDLFAKLGDVRNVITKAKGDLQTAINYQKTHGL